MGDQLVWNVKKTLERIFRGRFKTRYLLSYVFHLVLVFLLWGYFCLHSWWSPQRTPSTSWLWFFLLLSLVRRMFFNGFSCILVGRTHQLVRTGIRLAGTKQIWEGTNMRREADLSSRLWGLVPLYEAPLNWGDGGDSTDPWFICQKEITMLFWGTWCSRLLTHSPSSKLWLWACFPLLSYCWISSHTSC